MVKLFFHYLYICFSSWYCIGITLLIMSVLLFRENQKLSVINKNSPSVRCIEYGRIRVYFDYHSCLAGYLRKHNRLLVSIIEAVVSVNAILAISDLFSRHSVRSGIISVVDLIFLFSCYVFFNLIGCCDSLSDAGFYLTMNDVSNVIIDTDSMSLMVFSDDKLVAAAPITLENSFDPNSEKFDVYLGIAGYMREKALCCNGDW